MKMFTLKYAVIAIAVVFIAVFAWRYFAAPKTVPYEFAVAARADLVEEVSVTGKVKAAHSVQLAFEKGGRVVRARAAVGDRVAQGAMLVELDASELRSQLAEASAAREVQEAKLDEMRLGTRPEEIALAETKAASAKKSFADAQVNLENAKSKADADIKDDYDSALSAAVKSASIALNSLFVLTDLQNAYFSGLDQQGIQVSDGKAAAVLALLGVQGAGRAGKDYLSQFSGGAKGSVVAAQANPAFENIDKALGDMKGALSLVKAALDGVPVLSKFTSADAGNLNTEKNNVSAEAITIAGKQQAIAVQKAANQSSISAAEAGVNDAANARAAAEAELALKYAGYTKEQISAQEASALQAEAHAETIKAQLAKSVLSAPIAGVVTRQDAKEGEIVSAGVSVVSLISEAQFEMEAYVPEADVAKVRIGNEAQVTLDAYGNDTFFDAVTSAIDPAETIVEGVPTYKVTLQFTKKDERIKSGMTANIDIVTGKRTGAIVIPQRAVITKEGKKIVRIPGANNSMSEREMETGLRGNDGNIEILKGIQEGDRVITFVKE
ncbi:efflux RND transporter periplasmic adaptor subunit [Candidatus Azambacteria bacterium]|nr:efflux RND transporter periplasmic adaptor subunit [Candidatus Azambacteria bacterium]